ncbi:MAG: glutathione S-transferase [Blastomonas sp.]
MAETPILYSFRRCPYAMRARMALLASGTCCIIREVKLSAKPPELAEASAKATVPVLVLADGRVIDESIDIARWALKKSDPEGWLERSDDDLIAANDGPFKHDLDRYKYPERHGSDAHLHRARGVEFLNRLEDRLAKNQNLCGSGRGLADMAIMPFVRQFAHVDREWFSALPVPALRTWLDRHLASALFASAMVRLKPWASGDEPVLFGQSAQPYAN